MQNVNLWVANWWWSGMEGKKPHKWLWNPFVWAPRLQVITIILSCIQATKSKWFSWYLLLCGRWYMVNVKRLILTIHSKRTLWKISRCFEKVEDWGIKWEGEWKSCATKWIGVDIIKNNRWTCHLIFFWMATKFAALFLLTFSSCYGTPTPSITIGLITFNQDYSWTI